MDHAERRGAMIAALHEAELTLCRPELEAGPLADDQLARALEHAVLLEDAYFVDRIERIRRRLRREDPEYEARWGHPDYRTNRFHASGAITTLLIGSPDTG